MRLNNKKWFVIKKKSPRKYVEKSEIKGINYWEKCVNFSSLSDNHTLIHLYEYDIIKSSSFLTIYNMKPDTFFITNKKERLVNFGIRVLKFSSQV